GDCEKGQSCNGGRCDDIVGYCDTAGDCPDGQECQGNRCVAPLQSRDGDGTGAAGECELQSISFGFDADELDPSARSTAQANLRCMRDRGIEGVHLTGHADPRGTEEYNLALGDRRAHAVADYLSSLGLSSEATSTSSMGEEMARGTDEASYAKDRRVDIRAK
ncbi:MAG: OmpA family protein, partial [Myxococcales bacterium]|nr:OmpA family protein [Myxococcales bacterium]